MPRSKPLAQDVVLVHGVTEDRQGLAVLRARADRIEVGEVRPLREGAPIHGDVVRLAPRAECPLVCDVKVELAAPAAAAGPGPDAEAQREGRSGPAQVATPRYRANWDAIFGDSRAPKKAALN